jgi:hypothetical protein
MISVRHGNLERLAPEPRLYANQLRRELDAEIDRFREAEVQWAKAPSEAFERLAADGEPLIYVVSRRHELIVAEHVVDAHHSVLVNGDEVLAAGQVSLLVMGDLRIVLDLDAQSGHYLPSYESVYFAAVTLVDLGFAGLDRWFDS